MEASALTNTFSTLTVSGLTTLNGNLVANAGYNLSGATGVLSGSTSVTVSSATAATLTSVNGTVNVTTTGFGDINLKCLGGGGNIAISTNNNLSIDATSILTIGAGYALSINAGSGGTAINSGDFSVSNNVTLGSNSGNSLTVPATTTFQNGVTIGSSSSDLCTVKSVMAFNSTGRIQWQAILLPNSNSSVDVRRYKYIVIPSGTGPSIRTYTLQDTSTSDGDWFQIYNASSIAHTLTGAVSLSLGIGNTRQYVKIGGNWIQVSAF